MFVVWLFLWKSLWRVKKQITTNVAMPMAFGLFNLAWISLLMNDRALSHTSWTKKKTVLWRCDIVSRHTIIRKKSIENSINAKIRLIGDRIEKKAATLNTEYGYWIWRPLSQQYSNTEQKIKFVWKIILCKMYEEKLQ